MKSNISSLRSWLNPAFLMVYVSLGVAVGAPRHEAGTVSVSQANKLEWHSAQFTRPFPAPPVVILGPATMNDHQPLTLRVRNVSTAGFEYQMDEWDYLDGVHGEESISWLALEPGVHDINGQKWEAGRMSNFGRLPATVPLAGGFTSAPVVLAQLESVANTRALTTRIDLVKPSSFRVRLRAQQAFLGLLKGESVSFVAMSEGSGEIDGVAYRAFRTPFKVNHVWKPVEFGAAYSDVAFFAAMQTSNDPEPSTLRIRNVTESGAEIRVVEERSLSPLMTHTGEALGCLVLSAPTDEGRAKLEMGTLVHEQTAPDTWRTVTFQKAYREPVVIFGPVPENPGEAGGTDAAMVRVRNVTGSGFEFQVDEWDYQDGIHSPAAISYLAMEAGDYTLGGLRWHAGRVAGVTHAPSVESFGSAFAAVPVVLAQVATTNGTEATVQRLSGISATGFTLQLDEEEAADHLHVAEEVHYVAVEPGDGRFSNQILFQAATSTPAINQGFQRLAFQPKTADPFLLGAVQTRNEVDPVVPRYRGLDIDGFDIRLQEETSADAETTHAGEAFGYLSIAGAVDTDEDGLPDEWELAHGLNPNDPNDATSDTDGDGFNALAEYRFGTDPNVFDSGGTITVVADVADGYEKEGTAARFRIERTGGVVPTAVSFAIGGTAGSGDYVLRDGTGATLSGSILLPFGASFVEVVAAPVTDSLNEYPETVELMLSSSPAYTLGGVNSAITRINDASDVSANEQLFVAFLRAQGGAQTYASGLATLFLNGPKTAARVSLSFSGLTSNQTNAYIRYGVTQGVGPELRPTLPIGQVTSQMWSIAPVGSIMGQDIIDGLYQVPGKFVYINIGTGNYPVGEIAGTWTQQTGSSVFQPPGDPPALETLSPEELQRDVARFLTQATFGAKQEDIDALVASVGTTFGGDRIAAFNAWIDQQCALDQTKLLDYTQAADAEEWALRGASPLDYENGNEPKENNRRRGWWLIAARAHDQLRQRVAFALSEILVISDEESTIRKRHYGTANYYDQLTAAVDGNYRDLLETVSKSPMMGKYLSHLKNQKAIVDPVTGQVLVSPDENYAREVMQLFSIGLVHRHLDGTLKLGSDGLPIATYGNDDITDLARVLTGWSFSKRNGAKNQGYPEVDNNDFDQGNGPEYFQASWLNPMKNFADYHDTDAKTVLGTSIQGGLNGDADLDAALDILFNHPNIAPFISHLLIQRLVTSNPSAGYVYRVAKKFMDNGSGVRGDIKAVVKAILLDYEARSLAVTANIGYGKQKEPIVRYLQLLRAFDGKSKIPLTRLSGYGYPASQLDNFPAGTTLLRYPDTDARLGQTPQSAPSVFNWFLPDFNPGGALASAGLVAPEMQLTTETSVINAINYHYTLTNTKGQKGNPMEGSEDPDEDTISVGHGSLNQLYNDQIAAGKTTPEAVTAALDSVDTLLLSGQLRASYSAAPVPNPRSIIIDSVSSQELNPGARMEELLYLVVSSPEYIIQK